ncbi:MAG: Ldh family oxidoreductase, partial [Deltaproteobacteria bacterium]|nr:Ldh family oxidoreductase [Deltaproteobacteria bacterium]
MDKQVVSASYDELIGLGVEALNLAGVPSEHARTTTEVLLRADLRGFESHGIQRLLMYVPRLRQKLINPSPNIETLTLAPAIRLVSGDNGLGQVVASRGMSEAIQAARDSGLAFVGCKDSNHFGAAGIYVLNACEEKIIGIAGTNAFPTMAPWGGLEKRVGNNPLAIGIPSGDGNHFVLDIAMSVSSRGRIRMMAEKGESIPEGWALDARGNPTTDPLEALKGFVLPIGRHKGYGLAVAIDILSGVLTGAAFSTGVKSLLQQWEEPQHIGHFFITIDPGRFMPWNDFVQRTRELYKGLKSTKPIDPNAPVLIPGEPEHELERKRMAEGIPIDQATLIKL